MAGQLSLDLGEVADGGSVTTEFGRDPNSEESARTKVFEGIGDPASFGIMPSRVLGQNGSAGSGAFYEGWKGGW